MRFAGWVPNITGHLSFSLIGLRGGEPSCITCNTSELGEDGQPQRAIVVSQRRVTKDVPLPFRLSLPSRIKEYVLVGRTRPGSRPSIGVDGAIVPKTDTIGILEGDVFVIPHHRDRRANRRAKRLKVAIRDAISLHSGRNKARGVRSPLPDDIRKRIQLARDTGLKIPQVQFELHRTGELRIKLPEKHIPALAHQAYYFIKDISHRHYHHYRSSDNILPLTEVAPYDDEAWRRNTLWALARAVLEARRRDRLDAYKSALGILSYAEAFQNVLGRVRRGTQSEAKFVIAESVITYDFAQTRASLVAKIDENEYRETNSSQLFIFLLSSLLATAALWIGAVQIIAPVCDALHEKPCQIQPATMISSLARNVIVHPAWAAGVFILLSLIYFGRRAFSLRTLQAFCNWIDSWSQAAGASFSKSVRPILPYASDSLGRYFAALIAALRGAGLCLVIGRLGHVF